MQAPSRNVRGSSYDRRARRLWLVAKTGIPNKRGEKIFVACVHCGQRMRADKSTWDVDRYPVCGHRGGRYVHGNIVVSCPSCNRSRCKSCIEREKEVRVGADAAVPF